MAYASSATAFARDLPVISAILRVRATSSRAPAQRPILRNCRCFAAGPLHHQCLAAIAGANRCDQRAGGETGGKACRRQHQDTAPLRKREKFQRYENNPRLAAGHRFGQAYLRLYF
jgi:hypothetical protein